MTSNRADNAPRTIDAMASAFSWSLLRRAPLAGAGIAFVLLLRLLYGLFYTGATINKLQRDYMFSDYPLKVFSDQLAVIDPKGFPAWYLGEVIIPHYQLFGWLVTWGEFAVAVGLMLGLCTRAAGALALFITVNIGLGGFYDASLIPLGLIAALFVIFPTGQWLGLDRRLSARYPQAIWFK